MTDAETTEAWLTEAETSGDWHHTVTDGHLYANGVLIRMS